MNSTTNKYAFKYPVFVDGTLTIYSNSVSNGDLAVIHDNMFESMEHRFSRGIKKIVVTKFVPAPPEWTAEDYDAVRLDLAVNEACLPDLKYYGAGRSSVKMTSFKTKEAS